MKRINCKNVLKTFAAVAMMALVMGAFSQSANATVMTLLEDNFNDNSLDATKWNVVTAGIPQAGAAAVEQNGQIEFTGRAHLNTVQQFNPNDFRSGIKIEGQWEFVQGGDFMQVLTRSDGTPAGSFGETNAGIEFRAFDNGGDPVDIVGRGASIINKSGNGNMPGGIANGDIFDFVIMDDGLNLSFEFTRQSNPLDTLLVTAQSNFNPATNLISIHNRESGRRSNLDNLVVSTIVPEPVTGLLAMMGAIPLLAKRRRRA